MFEKLKVDSCIDCWRSFLFGQVDKPLRSIRYWRRLTSTEESWVSFFNVLPAVDNRYVALAAYVVYDNNLKCLKCLGVCQLKG